MRSVSQRNLEATREMLQEVREKSAAILKRQSEEEGRALTPEENDELAQNVKNIHELERQEADYAEQVRIERDVIKLGQHIGSKESSLELTKGIEDVQVKSKALTVGEIFTQSEQFKSIKESGRSVFSEAIEIDTKGTLLEGTLAPGSGSGGGFLTVPQVVPGVVDKLFQPLTVADIIPSGSTNTSTIRYVVEGTATSGAAGVAEGGAKPESTLGVGTTDEQVKKIATTLVVSDEMLEDSAQVESYINSRLSLFIRIEEERQLLLGAGGNDLTGITGRSGVNTYAAGTADNLSPGTVLNNAVALFKALNGTRGSALLEPDYIIMNPANWQTTRLLSDANGQLYGGGPFQGPYGNGQVDPASGQLTGAMDTLWNKPVIVTTAIGAGTALLGSFRAASQVFRRSGLTIEATNSHSDYFTKNLVAIRAELRLALAVYRPAAFTKVTGLN